MRRWRETVEVCLGVTGLRGAFSHGVVSEARRVLRQLWLTVIALRRRASETHNHECTCVCVCLCLCVCVCVCVCLLMCFRFCRARKWTAFFISYMQESFKIQELLHLNSRMN